MKFAITSDHGVGAGAVETYNQRACKKTLWTFISTSKDKRACTYVVVFYFDVDIIIRNIFASGQAALLNVYVAGNRRTSTGSDASSVRRKKTLPSWCRYWCYAQSPY